jgi:tripartite-type tricarboxylate transporter receptor subunit TctC
MTSRRTFLTAVLAGAAAPAVKAQEAYPARPVTFVVPGPAGSGADLIARLAAQKLGDELNQRVVVENNAGASGVIGVRRVARARPDGYTLLFSFNQPITMNPHVLLNLPYDVEKDLEPVSLFARSPFVWLVNAGVPARTFPEFVSYAKANPNKLAMGVYGFGSAGYLGAQLLSHATGAEFLAVNYSGNIVHDLVANVVQVTMSPAASVPPVLATGKVRALAQTGASRHPKLPDVPTVNEFVRDYAIDAWYAIWAPKGTPPDITARLSSAMVEIARAPDVAEKLSGLTATPVGENAMQLQETTRRESALWQNIVAARKIKPSQL